MPALQLSFGRQDAVTFPIGRVIQQWPYLVSLEFWREGVRDTNHPAAVKTLRRRHRRDRHYHRCRQCVLRETRSEEQGLRQPPQAVSSVAGKARRSTATKSQFALLTMTSPSSVIRAAVVIALVSVSNSSPAPRDETVDLWDQGEFQWSLIFVEDVVLE